MSEQTEAGQAMSEQTEAGQAMSEQTEAQARAEAARAYREYIAPVMRKAAERYMYRLERLRDEVARMYEREERHE